MARASKSKSAATGRSSYKFINISLTAEDKRALSSGELVGTLSLELMFDLVSSGYKVSLNEDTKNACCVCSITDTRTDSPFYQYILTGRGSNPFNAWLAAAYRHFVLAGEEWGSVSIPDSDGGSDFA